MSRTITFRAWYKEPGEPGKMIDVTELKTGPNIVGVIVNDLPNQKYIQSVMQYTGLRDKNGQRIFEGDVVEKMQNTIGSGKRMIVKWDRSRAGWSLTEAWLGKENWRRKDKLTPTSYWGHLGVVIGNIYENPELIDTPDRAETEASEPSNME